LNILCDEFTFSLANEDLPSSDEDLLPLDHFLPAVYLGAFSADANSVRRQRRLWVRDKKTRRIFDAPASRLCAIRDFYTLREPQNASSRVVDDQWADYEAQLGEAIDQLVSGSINAGTWLTILVRFVAGLLVRGLDFNRRFRRRVEHSLGPDFGQLLIIPAAGTDNINRVRLIEYVRLIAPIAGSQWLIFSVPDGTELPTNDLGFVALRDPDNGNVGAAIPLDRFHLLAITPQLRSIIAVARGGRWVPNIRYVQLSAEDRDGLVTHIATMAQRFVFGATKAVVRSTAGGQEVFPSVPDANHMGFLSGRRAIVHEALFCQLSEIFATLPPQSNTMVHVDFGEKIRKAEETGLMEGPMSFAIDDQGHTIVLHRVGGSPNEIHALRDSTCGITIGTASDLVHDTPNN
jgi:hypothetical protein